MVWLKWLPENPVLASARAAGRSALAVSLWLASSFGCSGADAMSESGGIWHDFDTWPERLSDFGVLIDPSRVTSEGTGFAPEALVYTPRFQLWTNGSRKLRHIVLPKGTRIDNSRVNWRFPDGTLAFKTMFFAGAGEQPVETRVIRIIEGVPEFAAYLWNSSGTEATLLSGREATPRSVRDFEGNVFEHLIPSRLDCRTCHESSPLQLLGVTSLQLASDDGAALARSWFESGLFAQDPTKNVAVLPAEDARTKEVLGYFYGNCSHCHNGWNGPSSTYSLLPDDALDNLIDHRTEGSASIDGIRVIPGDPESSVLFQAVAGHADGRYEALPMPSLGVQRADLAAIALIQGWIEALTSPETDESDPI